jgi:hypothetical protein
MYEMTLSKNKKAVKEKQSVIRPVKIMTQFSQHIQTKSTLSIINVFINSVTLRRIYCLHRKKPADISFLTRAANGLLIK